MAVFNLRNKFPNKKLYGFVKTTLEMKSCQNLKQK